MFIRPSPDPGPSLLPMVHQQRGMLDFNGTQFFANISFLGGDYMNWFGLDSVCEFSFYLRPSAETWTIGTIVSRYGVFGIFGLGSVGFFLNINGDGTLTWNFQQQFTSAQTVQTTNSIFSNGSKGKHITFQRGGRAANTCKVFVDGEEVPMTIITDTMTATINYAASGIVSNFQVGSRQNGLVWNSGVQGNKLKAYMPYLRISRNLRTAEQIKYELQRSSFLHNRDDRNAISSANHYFDFTGVGNFFGAFPVANRGPLNAQRLPSDTATGFMIGYSTAQGNEPDNPDYMRLES